MTRTAGENASGKEAVTLSACLILSWRWIETVFLSETAMNSACLSLQHWGFSSRRTWIVRDREAPATWALSVSWRWGTFQASSTAAMSRHESCVVWYEAYRG